MKIKKLLFLASALAVLPSCLQTVAELRTDPKHQQQIESSSAAAPATPAAPATKQQKEAVEVSRFDDINKDFRELYGRVEATENQVAQLKDSEKVKALEAKIVQLETKMGLLETTVADLHAKSKKEVATTMSSDAREATVKGGKGESIPLQEANKLFENKKWEDAILAFEEYRKTNPKGKNYADATYKIGQCFQNLSMKDDAKAFFKEVVDKFPQSKEAALAKTKLKKL